MKSKSDRKRMAELQDKSYDAFLNWWYIDYNGWLWGLVFEDRKARFRDGTLIHTSSIMALTEQEDVQTRNSIYRLGDPEGAYLDLHGEDVKEKVLKCIREGHPEEMPAGRTRR